MGVPCAAAGHARTRTLPLPAPVAAPSRPRTELQAGGAQTYASDQIGDGPLAAATARAIAHEPQEEVEQLSSVLRVTARLRTARLSRRAPSRWRADARRRRRSRGTAAPAAWAAT